MPGTPPASPAHIQYCNITLITTQHSQEGAKAEQEGATESGFSNRRLLPCAGKTWWLGGQNNKKNLDRVATGCGEEGIKDDNQPCSWDGTKTLSGEGKER
jgi:hypothetical protein